MIANSGSDSFLRRGLKFKPEHEIKEKTAIACLMRSGSNMTVNVLEDITGYYSGDDHAKNVEPNKWLYEQGYVKERVKDTYFIKTHYPLLAHKPLRIKEDYYVSKAVILVRSPIQMFPSCFEMMILNSHQKIATPEHYKENQELWEMMIEDYTEFLQIFVDFWVKSPIQYYFSRYEDLFARPYESLLGIVSFIEGRDVKGTDLDEKIKQRLEKSGLSSVYMKGPRYPQNKADKFTKAQVEKIVRGAPEYIRMFGYEDEFEAILGKDCGLFNYERDPEFKKGQKHNQEALARVLSKDYEPKRIRIVGADNIPLKQPMNASRFLPALMRKKALHKSKL
jgi:Sulfotransferase domain